MSKKMLIDASHPEETRVVIVNGSQIEELDFESQNKRQLRGNVYLARVTRVEPSLQAAFVEYGGNRHGFLAFSEIHPDYYQIPYEDRMALLEAEEQDVRAEDDDDDDDSDAIESEDSDAVDDEDDDSDISPEEDAADEADEEVALEQKKTASTRRKRMSRRRYKIQEVIKRGQILLIQVVKEERGNKGAAMTTYLSMAGRYCVLMPNTPRGGGISRKIPNGADRKRLKAAVSEFDVPQGMGVIVRTAGAKRTKIEIKRDYDYLCRLWQTTRDTTLKSIAPALIHEEGNLVKRSIRDLYNKDIDEVLVQGDEAYKTAKEFIKMLMPSHAKNVKAYKDPIPLYLRYQVESQIEDSLDSVVQLKSGGYLVIHPTEALVSVDVNSGRSTKERNVERTALKTNLEAADEVARQMRLRDLAGLIVIDFIDMDENRNNRAVEKRMKDALARDRARVQNSRISQFGLMEISRQRRRRSLLEGSTASCNHCDGVGRKRTIESSALRAIRAVEETGVRGKADRIRLKVAPDVALYIFNEKRDLLTAVDSQFNVFTELVGDESLIRPAFEVEVIEAAEDASEDPLIEIEKELKKLNREAQQAEKRKPRRGKKKSDEDSDDEDGETSAKSDDSNDEESSSSKRRRRRGRRGGRRRNAENDNSEENSASATDEENSEPAEAESKSEKPKSRRRRKSKNEAPEAETAEEASTDESSSAPKSKGRRRAAPKRRPKESAETSTKETSETDVKSEEAEKPKTARSTARRKAPARKPKMDDAAEAALEPTEDKPKRPGRKPAPKKKVAPKAAEVREPVKAKTADADKAPQSTSRRKAPSRKPKPDAETADAPEPVKTEKPKPATRAKKAPAKPKAAAKTKPAAKTKAAPRKKAAPKAKAVTAKKAPAKKATAAKTKAAPKRKAPAKPKAAAKPKPKEPEPAPSKTTVEKPVEAKPQIQPEIAPATEKKKKKSWWRILKD